MASPHYSLWGETLPWIMRANTCRKRIQKKEPFYGVAEVYFKGTVPNPRKRHTCLAYPNVRIRESLLSDPSQARRLIPVWPVQGQTSSPHSVNDRQ
jgi:hypothetical protein